MSRVALRVVNFADCGQDGRAERFETSGTGEDFSIRRYSCESSREYAEAVGNTGDIDCGGTVGKFTSFSRLVRFEPEFGGYIPLLRFVDTGRVGNSTPQPDIRSDAKGCPNPKVFPFVEGV